MEGLIEAYQNYFDAEGMFTKPENAVIAANKVVQLPEAEEFNEDWEHQELRKNERYLLMVMGEQTSLHLGSVTFRDYIDLDEEVWCVFTSFSMGEFAVKKSNTYTEQ